MIKQVLTLSVLVLCWALVGAPQAEALVLNMGVDIFNNGSYSVNTFYDESDTGENVSGGWDWLGLGIFGNDGETYTLILDTSAVFGAYAIHSAELFVDATAIGRDDNAQVRVEGVYLGELANTRHSRTGVPVETGGSKHAPDSGDVDNTFFSLPGSLADALANETAFEIAFRNADTNYGFFPNPNDFRVDGINIQAEVSQKVAMTHTPEPASIALFMMGGLGVAGFNRRRFRV